MKPYTCNCGSKPLIIHHPETLHSLEYVAMRCSDDDCREIWVSGESEVECVEKWNRAVRRSAER